MWPWSGIWKTIPWWAFHFGAVVAGKVSLSLTQFLETQLQNSNFTRICLIKFGFDNLFNRFVRIIAVLHDKSVNTWTSYRVSIINKKTIQFSINIHSSFTRFLSVTLSLRLILKLILRAGNFQSKMYFFFLSQKGFKTGRSHCRNCWKNQWQSTQPIQCYGNHILLRWIGVLILFWRAFEIVLPKIP